MTTNEATETTRPLLAAVAEPIPESDAVSGSPTPKGQTRKTSVRLETTDDE